MPAAAEPQRATLPLPGGREGATVRLHPLLCGVSKSGLPGWFYREPGRLAALRAFGLGVPRDQRFEVPIVAFLVEHPRVGAMMIDTGLHPSVAVDIKQNFGRLSGRAFSPMDMAPAQSIPAQLRERGMQASDIRVVVMTHLHVDHASGVSELPDATFVVDRREWDAAIQPRGAFHGYVRRQFDHAFDWRTVDFDSRESDSFATFGRAYDLFGDGSVRLVSTPGHTLGHMSVVLRLQGREALIAGDAIYTMRSLREGAVPYRMEDEHLFRRSLREIQIYSEQTPDALIVPGHDMEAWRALEPVY